MPMNYNGLIWRPTTGVIYLFDSVNHTEDDFDFDNADPVMNARAWMNISGGHGMGSRAASIQSELAELSDVFYNTPVPGLRHPITNAPVTFEDMAKEVLHGSDRAASTKDMSRAGAVITSLDYANFQDVVVVGENAESRLNTGVLPGLFESVNLDNLTGKWATMDEGILWQNDLPESSTPEPSSGTGSTITVNVPKGGGAVAWTDRARKVINGANPFDTIVAKLQRARLKNENALTADEIELNTTPTLAGVDFGARTGSPPGSTTNPVDFLASVRTTFNTKKLPANLFVTKGLPYTEYITNDIIRGSLGPPPAVGEIDQQVGPWPLMPGVTWARDEEISSAVNGWLMNDAAIKIFRSNLIQYTVRDEDHEFTKYVTKDHVKPKTVDAGLIVMVTGIAA